MKIYVASSWRNPRQPHVVDTLKLAGHEVYDFRHPAPGNEGFHWSAIDPHWKEWDASLFRNCLQHPIADAGFKLDFDAMKWADACVLVLPCGRSAHLELGWAVGAGKKTFAILEGERNEPELMYKMVDHLCLTVNDVVEILRREVNSPAPREPLDRMLKRNGIDIDQLDDVAVLRRELAAAYRRIDFEAKARLEGEAVVQDATRRANRLEGFLRKILPRLDPAAPLPAGPLWPQHLYDEACALLANEEDTSCPK